MNPSQNKENAHAFVLHTLLTILRAIKMDRRKDFRTAGATIEAHLLQLPLYRRSSLPTSSLHTSSRLAESDSTDP